MGIWSRRSERVMAGSVDSAASKKLLSLFICLYSALSLHLCSFLCGVILRAASLSFSRLPSLSLHLGMCFFFKYILVQKSPAQQGRQQYVNETVIYVHNW